MRQVEEVGPTLCPHTSGVRGSNSLASHPGFGPALLPYAFWDIPLAPYPPGHPVLPWKLNDRCLLKPFILLAA